MAEAGYADGAELTFYVTQGGSGMLDPVPMGEAIQADLAAVGFDVTIQTFEWNAFLNEVNAGIEGKANMAEMAWMTDEPGTLPFLTLRTSMWPAEGGFNSGYYSNPRVDELLEQAAVETDQDVRAELFHEMQRIVVEDAPWVFVANASQIVAHSDDISGFRLHPSFTQLRLGTANKGS
jgi:peptide/nickel transport system substrate-binding protein